MATVMKMKSSFLGMVFCAATSLSAVGLTVGQGETLDVTESAVYETVTVHGTLNIESGAKLTATVLMGLNLVPENTRRVTARVSCVSPLRE